MRCSKTALAGAARPPARLARPAVVSTRVVRSSRALLRPHQMVNLVTAYFDTLLTQGDSSIIKDILEPTIRCGLEWSHGNGGIRKP